MDPLSEPYVYLIPMLQSILQVEIGEKSVVEVLLIRKETDKCVKE
jgi:hypothetical protein